MDPSDQEAQILQPFHHLDQEPWELERWLSPCLPALMLPSRAYFGRMSPPLAFLASHGSLYFHGHPNAGSPQMTAASRDQLQGLLVAAHGRSRYENCLCGPFF